MLSKWYLHIAPSRCQVVMMVVDGMRAEMVQRRYQDEEHVITPTLVGQLAGEESHLCLDTSGN
jgi:hypothetical protein